MLLCIQRMLGACGGFRAQGQGTMAHLCSSSASCGPPDGDMGGGGRLCVLGAVVPRSGAGKPYTKVVGEPRLVSSGIPRVHLTCQLHRLVSNGIPRVHLV